MAHHTEEHRERELPEHETRPEGGTGAGLTSAGVTAEQRGPENREVLDAQDRREEPVADDEEDIVP